MYIVLTGHAWKIIEGNLLRTVNERRDVLLSEVAFKHDCIHKCPCLDKTSSEHWGRKACSSRSPSWLKKDMKKHMTSTSLKKVFNSTAEGKWWQTLSPRNWRVELWIDLAYKWRSSKLALEKKGENTTYQNTTLLTRMMWVEGRLQSI